jgi:hypothetical protein
MTLRDLRNPRNLTAAWRVRVDTAATAGDETYLTFEARIVLLRCADELDALTKELTIGAPPQARQTAAELWKALERLVELKKHRDQYGKTPGFKEAVHEAWIAARLLLARIEKD